MIDGAGGGKHHVRRMIVRGEIGLEMGGLEAPHAAGSAEDRPPGRLVGKRRGLNQVEYHVLRRILRRCDLLEDHVALARKLSAVKARGEDDVAQDIEGEPEILTQHARVICRGVDAGRGVQFAADLLDLLCDVLGTAASGALEGHMLEEMRNAVLGQALAAAAGADPDAEGHGLDVSPGMAHHGETIRQSGQLDTHAPTSVRARA